MLTPPSMETGFCSAGDTEGASQGKEPRKKQEGQELHRAHFWLEAGLRVSKNPGQIDTMVLRTTQQATRPSRVMGGDGWTSAITAPATL